MSEKISPLMNLLFNLKVIGPYKMTWRSPSVGPVMGMCEFVPYEVRDVTVEYHGRER